MYETEAELAALQDLIDQSIVQASPQLRAIAHEGRRLSAAQVVDALRGRAQMAVATVTARAEPRVSPLDVLLMHGRFYFCTSARAAKVGHLRRRPAVSLAYIDSDIVGITVHGRASLHEWGGPRFAELDREFLAVYGGTPSTEEEAVVFIEVEPERLYTYDRRIERDAAAELGAGSLVPRFAWTGGHADVWRWFDDAEMLRAISAALVAPFRDAATKVAGVEARGFILGAACALELGVGFVPIRKGAGLLPGPKAAVETAADYRGGRQLLRVQHAALGAGDRVLLVDDWIETGSQAVGARTLIERCGATFLGVAAIVDQLPRSRHEQLVRVHTLLPKGALGDDG